MKFIAIFILFLLVSCSSNESNKFTELSINNIDANAITRGGVLYDRVSLVSDESNDEADILNIAEALFSTEKETQLLDVKFTAAVDSVTNGMFLFGIETENDKNLSFEIYDEEGYDLVGRNGFVIYTGQNYKALNLNTLESGSYVFRLRDDKGAELNHTITVKNN